MRPGVAGAREQLAVALDDPAGAGVDGDAGALGSSSAMPGVGQREHGGADGELGEPAHPARDAAAP